MQFYFKTISETIRDVFVETIMKMPSISFFECANYSNLREIMFRQTRKYHPLSLNTVLFGKSTLSDDDNVLLFQAVP